MEFATSVLHCVDRRQPSKRQSFGYAKRDKREIWLNFENDESNNAYAQKEETGNRVLKKQNRHSKLTLGGFSFLCLRPKIGPDEQITHD